jgi:hypothetical protein
MSDQGQPRPRKTKPKPEDQLHPVAKWVLRTVGLAAELFGWGGIMLADWFVPAVICIYFGFVLLAIDVGIHPEFRGKLKWKLTMWTIIAALATGFSWGFVFVRGPLPVFAFVTDGEYPEGQVIAGIPWRPQFTELTVDIKNPTDRPYEDLDLVIRPTDIIAAIAQKTSVPNVTFSDKNGITPELLDKNNQTGNTKVVPLVLVGTDAGYRMQCPRLPANTVIEVVIALADIKWGCPHPLTGPSEVLDPNYMLRVKNDEDFSSYYMGYKEGDDYRPRPTSTEWLRIEGEYVVAHGKRHISQKVQINGKITIKQPS